MKVLQTLGAHSGRQVGIFQYRRTPKGVYVDASIGQANLRPNQIQISSDEWNAILGAMQNATTNTFRLTPNRTLQQPPNQSLYEVLATVVPQPTEGWAWNDSWKSYVCAILEHEGSVDLYHGPLGPKATAIITLRSDVSLSTELDVCS
jgi:hypothetical protein